MPQPPRCALRASGGAERRFEHGLVFGISSRDWLSFYHFTVGVPAEDKRLTTLPTYKLEEER